LDRTAAGVADIGRRRPRWLPSGIQDRDCLATRSLLDGIGVETVCHQARCPNQARCFSSGLATFLILGAVCSRNCRFCNISGGVPETPDPDEPARVAEAIRRLGLGYTVITSVTRDDLDDGGAGHFVRTVEAVRRLNPECRIELLIPDFNGSDAALDAVIRTAPDVLAHNVETVPRLYSTARPSADYRRSIRVIERAAESGLVAKSGLMLGLGESDEEIAAVLSDLLNAGCRLVTLGQYLPPSRKHLPVRRFVPPEEFERWAAFGRELGLRWVESGPMVRSSYLAHTYAPKAVD
jgi:lipoic acid synthetase